MREKLATLKRPKKYKTSENDYSHGSFFLRIGGIGEKYNCNCDKILDKSRQKSAVSLINHVVLHSFSISSLSSEDPRGV